MPLAWLLWFWRRRHSVPFCGRCRVGLFRDRLLACAVIAAVPAVAWFVVRPWLDELGWSAYSTRKAAFWSAVVLLAPVLFWFVRRPAPLAITSAGGSVTFEFQQGDYARQFRAANARRP